MTKRLTTLTNNNQILKYNQVGFRKGFRTSDHVFTIKTVINKYLQENKKLYLCFVDFRKAYDSIWREALFYKLSAYYGVSKNFINILENIYNKVHLSVRLPNGITRSFSSNITLKQGCNLGPILINIFINDLNEIFAKTFFQSANIKNLTLNNLLYTDDLVLVAETSSGFQNCLDRLQEYCYKWRLTVDIKKTKTMVVEKPQSPVTQTSFTYKNNALDMCKSYSYLGTILSNNGQLLNFTIRPAGQCTLC